VNTHFQAKSAKYPKFHIIETTTDYNQILHTSKDHQICFMGRPETGQTHPRWWTAAILKNEKNVTSQQPFGQF